MSLVNDFAERIGAMTFDSLPPEAVHWARVGVLDTVGVTLAGSGEPCAAIAARITASPGPALLFGTGRRVTALDAAQVNGTASHALDFDDCSDSLGGHPSAQVLAALFALADTIEASGQDFLLAYVAGFETETRLARAVNFHHYEKGWHPTATLGVFGAAAACARLLGLDPARTATALAIAASFASGIKANFGTMTKPLHVGQAARNGLYAALLAQDGFTASDNAFEHGQGWFNVYNGPGTFFPEKALEGWAAPLDILEPGIAIKQYPCCGSTHPAIDAMIDLANRHALTPEMVEHIDVWIHARRLAHTNRPDPRSDLDAKFSVQYVVARALQSRRIVLSDFEGGAHEAQSVRAIMGRLQAAPHPRSKEMASTEHFGAEITIRLHDGRVLTGATDRPLGRGPSKPLPLPALEAKFLDCAARSLGSGTARRALGMVWRIDELDQMAALSCLLAEGAADPAAVPRATASSTLTH